MARGRTPRLTGVSVRITQALISETPLDVDAAIASVDDPRAGATVSFAGVVRNHDHGRDVTAIDYSGHPDAAKVIEGIAAEFADADGVHALAVAHRIGALIIGDVALVVAVSASHRAEAFAVASQVVERVKQSLPIWKKQHFTDGTSEWSNCP